MLVYVLNKYKKPLMPCSSRKARLLLKNGKAKVACRCPFTIKILYGSSGYKQEVRASLIPSSSKVGIACSSNGTCLYSSEVELRQDISKKMKRRSSYRRTRRNRKTRYRECRFLNRKSDRKFTPTMMSKFESHAREIQKLSKLLPISNWIVVKNSVKKDYQGPKDLEWLNLQRQTFERDRFKCTYCKGKSKCYELHAHHLIFRSEGGEDVLDNLTTLCKKCHVSYHEGEIELKRVKSKGKIDTELAIIRENLKLHDNIQEIYGFEVKAKRKLLNLKPTPINNACSILEISPANSYHIKNVSKGDYQRTKGVRSQIIIPKGKIFGFNKFDKVKFKNNIYFIKGRMSTGYFIGMDILGNTLKGKTLKAKECKLISRRSSCLITETVEENTCYNAI